MTAVYKKRYGICYKIENGLKVEVPLEEYLNAVNPKPYNPLEQLKAKSTEEEIVDEVVEDDDIEELD